jgi:Recombinase
MPGKRYRPPPRGLECCHPGCTERVQDAIYCAAHRRDFTPAPPAQQRRRKRSRDLRPTEEAGLCAWEGCMNLRQPAHNAKWCPEHREEVHRGAVRRSMMSKTCVDCGTACARHATRCRVCANRLAASTHSTTTPPELRDRILAMARAGERAVDITARLNEEGIPSPMGRRWNPGTIGDILRKAGIRRRPERRGRPCSSPSNPTARVGTA